ncbi:hypothetical protein SAMD00023520_02166 [Listeria monocytogenes]|nr:hypothetical protein SAMD00023520_02166 [Listeria monocytogenes]
MSLIDGLPSLPISSKSLIYGFRVFNLSITSEDIFCVLVAFLRKSTSLGTACRTTLTVSSGIVL